MRTGGSNNGRNFQRFWGIVPARSQYTQEIVFWTHQVSYVFRLCIQSVYMRLFILYDISLLFKTLTFEHIYAILKSGSSKEKEDDMNLFVYGTLTKPRVQQKVLGHTAQSQPAILNNHTLIRTPPIFDRSPTQIDAQANHGTGLLLSGL